MRKYFYLFVVMCLILTTGCTNSPSNLQADTLNDDYKPVNQEQSSTGTNADSKPVDSTSKTEDTSKQKITGYTNVTLYYQDANGYIIPVTRKFGKQEGIAKAAILGLIDSSDNREEIEYYGIYPVLPNGTDVLGITIKDGTATIDFNNKLIDYKDGTAERNIITSIVYTLTEFKTIKAVKIVLNGHIQGKLKYGTDISNVLKRDNVLVNASKVNLTSGMQKHDVYLFKSINEKYNYLLPVSREHSNIKDEEVPAKIISFLCTDISDKKLFSQIPQLSKLISSSTKGNILTLNLNKEFKNYGGNTREQGILYQLQYSMKQIDGIEKIKLLIEGVEFTLPEGTEITGGLAISSEINNFIDLEG